MIIDTHAHLMFPEFDGDLEEVLKRAGEVGVEKIINVGCGIESSNQAVKMAGNFEQLYATVALHPYDAADFSEALMMEWEKLIDVNDKIVAIGETGLDYLKSKVDPEIQKVSFRGHLQLARRSGLPVIIHNRGADNDCLEILTEFDGTDGKPKVEAVFHCFGSDLGFAHRVWAAGYFTSFTGIITYSSAEDLREVVRAAPLEKMMVETDCPYLSPQIFRGKRNEPAYVREVLSKILELRKDRLDGLEEVIYQNAMGFFGLK